VKVRGRKQARIEALQRAVAERDLALQMVRYHAREIELKAASFGLDRILEPRLREIERHALDARLVAERYEDGS
jgi:hypothetical protein